MPCYKHYKKSGKGGIPHYFGFGSGKKHSYKSKDDGIHPMLLGLLAGTILNCVTFGSVYVYDEYIKEKQPVEQIQQSELEKKVEE